MTWELRGRTVFVTGAARGIGAETARRAAAAGANVALVGLEPEELAHVAAQCGANAAPFECDVTDWHALERAVEGTVERFGGIDVVMANAGIAPAAATVAGADPEAFERVIDVNLLGVWRTVRATLPHVRARRGYVLCIASIAAAVHVPLLAPYNMAKAGVEALADSLRAELAGDGVDVGCAYFGLIDTDMVRGAFAESSTQRLRTQVPAAFTRPLPVAAAAHGLERGIERRARRIVVPRSAIPILFGGRLLQSLSDAGYRRAGIADVVRDIES
jgi:NAD(P)-dependent dehydrogenase (short-subunit alcohol dehydrogenase family)